jgi:hypothetical protein
MVQTEGNRKVIRTGHHRQQLLKTPPGRSLGGSFYAGAARMSEHGQTNPRQIGNAAAIDIPLPAFQAKNHRSTAI